MVAVAAPSGGAPVRNKPRPPARHGTISLLAYRAPTPPPIPSKYRARGTRPAPAPSPSRSVRFPTVGRGGTAAPGGLAVPVPQAGRAAPGPGAPTVTPPPRPVAAPQPYVNPLRGIKGLTAERVDQGVDYAGTGPIYAPGKGVITYSGVGNQTGWGPPNNGVAPGGYVAEKLSAGPAKGQTVYFAEGIYPTVKAGQQVTPKTVIARMVAPIETGFASGQGTQTKAAATGELSGPTSTAWGNAWSRVLHALGAPAGIVQGGGVGPGNVPDYAAGLKPGSAGASQNITNPGGRPAPAPGPSPLPAIPLPASSPVASVTPIRPRLAAPRPKASTAAPRKPASKSSGGSAQVISPVPTAATPTTATATGGFLSGLLGGSTPAATTPAAASSPGTGTLASGGYDWLLVFGALLVVGYLAWKGMKK